MNLYISSKVYSEFKRLMDSDDYGPLPQPEHTEALFRNFESCMSNKVAFKIAYDATNHVVINLIICDNHDPRLGTFEV